MDLDRLLAPTVDRGATWSVQVRRVGGVVVAEHDPERLLRTASVGKLFLLMRVAALIGTGELDRRELLDRADGPAVADSGLWQHLDTDRLPVEDVARLVGAVSDNWATNVLLARVGVESLPRGPRGSRLHGYVRDTRGPADPPTLSEGCAADWVEVLLGLSDGSPVLDWISLGVDLSMVGSAFGLDPLAHQDPDRGVRLWSKTGTSDGVRADVGLVELDGRRTAYAAICNWPPDSEDLRDRVLAAMRAIGDALGQLDRSY
ncbi:serine hydrolase [Nocardioides sp.]|uniref:serine hydrolase n=1 Tax=Nocardioides sp. TaxID=35761 RepID=UPI002ED345E5